MTQEDKDLLLKDLCGRLPYGVKIKTPSDCWTSEEGICELKEIFKGGDGLFRIGDIGALIEYSKPYLFPLSSMTEEQWIDLKEYSGFKYDGCLLDLVKYTDSVSTLEFWVEEIPSNMIIRVFDWLNKNHFDYRGLIPMGLAKDATGLNIYY